MNLCLDSNFSCGATILKRQQKMIKHSILIARVNIRLLESAGPNSLRNRVYSRWKFNVTNDRLKQRATLLIYLLL